MTEKQFKITLLILVSMLVLWIGNFITDTYKHKEIEKWQKTIEYIDNLQWAKLDSLELLIRPEKICEICGDPPKEALQLIKWSRCMGGRSLDESYIKWERLCQKKEPD